MEMRLETKGDLPKVTQLLGTLQLMALTISDRTYCTPYDRHCSEGFYMALPFNPNDYMKYGLIFILQMKKEDG